MAITNESIAAAREAGETIGPCAVSARYRPSIGKIEVDFDNGVTLAVQVSLIEGLGGATDADLKALHFGIADDEREAFGLVAVLIPSRVNEAVGKPRGEFSSEGLGLVGGFRFRVHAGHIIRRCERRTRHDVGTAFHGPSLQTYP